MFYFLRDASLSPKVQGISLPNNKDLINVQFVDDTAFFLQLVEDNFSSLFHKLRIFCEASQAKVSAPKSMLLGWENTPPGWLSKFEFQWGGPSKQIKYLGIPFAVNPSLKDMWLWIRAKLEHKLNKWNKMYLPLASRLQVCQKVLSSYTLYCSSVWMFCNYQINDIQKVIRRFLWFDGKGNRKWHSVKWGWCCLDKCIGSLGLKDIRLQSTSLATKWILYALEGDEPWKILVRNNIRLVVPKQAKGWKQLPFVDLIAGKFPISPARSSVFKTIWKAWEYARHLIANNGLVDNNNTIAGEKSIWWNLLHNDKPQALIQRCSAKSWALKGIKTFNDIICDGALISWDILQQKYHIPRSNGRTYSMIKAACDRVDLSIPCVVREDRSSYTWMNGPPLPRASTKLIYNCLLSNDDIFIHLNSVWDLQYTEE